MRTLMLPAGGVSAATTEDSVTLIVPLDSPGSGTLKAFDPALGTLTSVELTIRTDVLVQNCIENLSTASGSTVGGPIRASLSATFPTGQNTTAAVIDTSIAATTLPASNGSNDCSGQLDAVTPNYAAPVSASDVRFFQDAETASTSRSFTALADVAPFIGPGTVPFAYTSSSLADSTQPSEWDIVFIARGTLAITVRYNYEPPGSPTTTTTTTPGALPVTGGGVTAGMAWAAGLVLALGVSGVLLSRRRPA